MKIAICFNGQVRTGIQTAPNIKRFIGELWDSCDFFIHTWNFESSKSFSRDSINGVSLIHRDNFFITDNKIETFFSLYQPRVATKDDFEFYSKTEPKNINPVWYSISKSFNLMESYSTEFNINYDAVVKIRPDVIFGKNRKLENEINFYLKDTSILYSDVYTKTRLDDVFWILNFKNACKIVDIFDYIKSNMTTDEKHTVLDFLNFNSIVNLSTCRNYFQYTIYRSESYMFNPMTQFKECFRNDLLHYATGIDEKEYLKKIEIEDKTGINYD